MTCYFPCLLFTKSLRRPQTVPTCWRGLLCYIFPSKKQPKFFDFHSFASWLSINNVRAWSRSMFDNRPHDRLWRQKNTWLNKKVDTAKRGRRDVCQPCSGVTGWGYKDIHGDDENELQIILKNSRFYRITYYTERI